MKSILAWSLQVFLILNNLKLVRGSNYGNNSLNIYKEKKSEVHSTIPVPLHELPQGDPSTAAPDTFFHSAKSLPVLSFVQPFC